MWFSRALMQLNAKVLIHRLMPWLELLAKLKLKHDAERNVEIIILQPLWFTKNKSRLKWLNINFLIYNFYSWLALQMENHNEFEFSIQNCILISLQFNEFRVISFLRTCCEALSFALNSKTEFLKVDFSSYFQTQ